MKTNVSYPKYIDIYEFKGGWGGHKWSTIHFLFIIQKTEKVQDMLKSNSTSFDLRFFFLGRIIKTLRKGGS